MKRHGFFLFLAILALCGHAGRGWASEEAAAKHDEKPAEDKHDAKPAEKKDEHGGNSNIMGPDRVYVNLSPLILPIITDDGAQQIVTMLISLQVKDLSTSDEVRSKLPRLVDAYMSALYGRLNADTMIGGKLINVDYVKSVLMRASDKILGAGVVQDVLIQGVAQRQL